MSEETPLSLAQITDEIWRKGFKLGKYVPTQHDKFTVTPNFPGYDERLSGLNIKDCMKPEDLETLGSQLRGFRIIERHDSPGSERNPNPLTQIFAVNAKGDKRVPIGAPHRRVCEFDPSTHKNIATRADLEELRSLVAQGYVEFVTEGHRSALADYAQNPTTGERLTITSSAPRRML